MPSTPTISPESPSLPAGPPSVSTVHVSPSAPARPEPSLAPPWLMRRFSVAEYQRLIELGILNESEQVELLDGWIVHKMPRNPPHDVAIWLATEQLRVILPPEWITRVQLGATTAGSQPEPDLAVVRGPGRRYADHHPTPEETALVIEVADSSVTKDRSVKGPIYARDRIESYWIINLPDHCVEVYSEPSGPDPMPGYRSCRTYNIDESVPLTIEQTNLGVISVRELLP